MATLFDDNEERQIDNPLAHIRSLQSLDNLAEEFAALVEKEPDKRLFIAAARAARDPFLINPEVIPGLSSHEAHVLNVEHLNPFWKEPIALRMNVAMLCLGGVIQGWTQTSSNGANQSWPESFGLRNAENQWDSNSAIWVFGLVNAATFCAASLFGCW
jgi:hypothetical protein